jgi:hypothetical protein
MRLSGRKNIPPSRQCKRKNVSKFALRNYVIETALEAASDVERFEKKEDYQ